MTTDTAEKRAWDRLPDEPSLWYERFLMYRDIGPARSVNRAYKRYRVRHDPDINEESDCKSNNASPNWYDACRDYDWLARATLYDDWLLVGADDRIKQSVQRWRIQAQDDLQAVWSDLVGQWEQAPDDMTKYQVSQAMKTVARTIADVAPGGKSNVQFRVVLNNLPPEMQKALAEALDTDK